MHWLLVPWGMWLWFQIFKFQTRIMEWRTSPGKSVLIYRIYIDNTFWYISQHKFFSFIHFYYQFSNNFKLTWVRCISISYIDTILNFLCINFLPVPQPLTQAMISQIYNMQNIFITIPIVFGSDWPLTSRSNVTLNQISSIPGSITRVNTQPIDDARIMI